MKQKASEWLDKLKSYPKIYWVVGIVATILCGGGIVFATLHSGSEKEPSEARTKQEAAIVDGKKEKQSKDVTEEQKAKDPLSFLQKEDAEKGAIQRTATRSVTPQLAKNLAQALSDEEQKTANREKTPLTVKAVPKEAVIAPLADQKAQENTQSGKETVEKKEPTAAIPTVHTDPVPVDYSQLHALISQGEAYNEERYFTESFHQFRQELTLAEALCQTSAVPQFVINQEVVRLQAAMDQLILRGNKQELAATLMQIQALNREAYTSATIHVLDEATKTAQHVADTLDVTQTQVNEQVNALRVALSQLVKRGNKAALIEELNYVKGLRASAYTTATAKNLNNVFLAAEAVNEDIDALQLTIDQTVQALKEAVDQLVLRGNKAKLVEVLESVTHIDREIYTKDSLAILGRAAAVGKKVNRNVDATQPEVDQALLQVHAAMDQLKKLDEPALSLVTLRRLITSCDALQETAYTPATFAPFKEELEKAKALVTQLPLTQERVQEEIAALQEVKENLVQRADKKALQTLITASEGLVVTDYTEDSWNVFEQALVQAKAVNANENATQAQVEAQVTQLHAAKTQLIKSLSDSSELVKVRYADKLAGGIS